MIERGPEERRAELLANITAVVLNNPHDRLTPTQAFERAQEIVRLAHDEAYKALRYATNRQGA